MLGLHVGPSAALAETLERTGHLAALEPGHVLRSGHPAALRRVGRGRSSLETGLAVLVVDGSFIGVRENIVRLADAFEHGLGLLRVVLVLVGVPLYRHLAVRLLQLVVVGVPVHAKHGIVVSGRGHSLRRFREEDVRFYEIDARTGSSRGMYAPRVGLTERRCEVAR